MFSAGSNLKDKSDEEIFYQDFKRFTSGKVTIGVGQITSLNGGELDKLKGRMEAFMEKHWKQWPEYDILYADEYIDRDNRTDL